MEKQGVPRSGKAQQTEIMASSTALTATEMQNSAGRAEVLKIV